MGVANETGVSFSYRIYLENEGWRSLEKVQANSVSMALIFDQYSNATTFPDFIRELEMFPSPGCTVRLNQAHLKSNSELGPASIKIIITSELLKSMDCLQKLI